MTISIHDIPIFILAGGQGTRMGGWRSPVKGLVEVNGQPIVTRIVGQYLRAGFRKIYILGGFEFQAFETGFRDFFTKPGWVLDDALGATSGDIRVQLLDTGWDEPDLVRLERGLNHAAHTEIIGLTYGDSLANAELNSAAELSIKSGSGTMTIFERDFTIGEVFREGDAEPGRIESYEKTKKIITINAGYMFLWRGAIDSILASGGTNVDEVIHALIAKNELLVGTLATKWFGFDRPGDVLDFEIKGETHPEFDFPTG